MKDFGHGAVGTRETAFTSLLSPNKQYDPHLLLALSASIKAEVDSVKDGADPEENLWMPAGYTYLGQFIDHDLTFDNTSSLNPTDTVEPGKKDRIIVNLRSPRFDLDSLYGDGPDAQPFMYDDDGASLLLKDGFENQCQSDFNQAHQDLLRSPNGRAIIGDKRNDENSIVNQIHLTFIKFHNAVVAKLKIAQPDLQGTLLFQTAQKEVRWAYQLLVIEDFLPRIVQAKVLEDLKGKSFDDRAHRYALYTQEKRTNLPLEFVGAAYRFGHSGVRFGYRLNTETSLSIFPPSEPTTSGVDSLLGFDPLPESHVIDDWGRFFPLTGSSANELPAKLGNKPDFQKNKDGTLELDEFGGKTAIPNPKVRLQFAYKIDTTLADPLAVLPANVLPTSNATGGAIQEVNDKIAPKTLPDPKGRPSLALLNLLRGNTYKIQGGQAIAKVLKDHGHQVEPLDPKYLVTRTAKTIDGNTKHEAKTSFRFESIASIDPCLLHDTPLWFYILAEAQSSVVDALNVGTNEFDEDRFLEPAVAKAQLGWVGGRIVAEVFYGLMDSDDDSYFNASPPGWKPIWAHEPGACQKPIFANLLKFAGQRITHPPVV
jgi:Animal haem peroxidase